MTKIVFIDGSEKDFSGVNMKESEIEDDWITLKDEEGNILFDINSTQVRYIVW